MSEIKINIPARMYYFIKKYPKVDWNEIVINAIDKKLKEIQLLTDLKDCADGELAIARGEGISFNQVIKEMGLEKEFIKNKIKKKKTYARKK